MRLRRAVAALWVSTVLYWPAQVLVAKAWPTPYSWRDDVISALGAATCTEYCSPDHGVMNATFVAVGALTAAGAAVLVPQTTGRDRTGWLLIAASGLATSAVGFLPMDVSSAAHNLAAKIHWALQVAGMIVLATGSAGRDRRALALAVACTAAAVIGGAAFLTPGTWGLGAGLSERIALDSLNVWTIGMGVLLLRGLRPVSPSR
ncbi:Protein of unknown function [Rhodococcoides kroppenstedtii]|uniref:DUF998 domain-containing protein n=1 Tax=Rhodococcoides kroppenstedtii TaxID=293050 RepID=A0A1I0SX04_9NOCA|nr:DUF998 domain-containing protein [Rhodococcus kroppenstedtii]SFA43923.1 Protein of unknown function [Rhodococcus kroppenstedtii]